MGAYFVRRNSGDALYRTVLARYVQMATEAGVTQAVFPEGGLTVDGRLRTPKFGLLDYMLKTFDENGERDLVFVPVGLNYDRVLEDRSQLLRMDREAARRHPLAGAATAAGFVLSNLWLAVTGRWHRFGYACVNFGSPVSMRAHVRERGLHFPALDDAARHAEVTALGERLMGAIGRVVPVLPVSLIAAVFVEYPGRALSELELKVLAHTRLRELEAGGAHLYVPREDMDYAVVVGLRMLVMRHLVIDEGGLLRAASGAQPVLAYYANAIAHLERKPAASL
jgi:glycerol-3-phosphate O-acyltransferase